MVYFKTARLHGQIATKKFYWYCKATKEGGREWCQTNRHDFVYNRRCFLVHLKRAWIFKLHLSWSIFSSALQDADDADAVIFHTQLGQPPLQCSIGGSLPTADVSLHQLVQWGEEGQHLWFQRLGPSRKRERLFWGGVRYQKVITQGSSLRYSPCKGKPPPPASASITRGSL